MKKIFLLILGLSAMGIVVLYSRAGRELQISDPASVHVSRYAEEAGYVESTVDQFKDSEKLDAEDVFGGITSHHIPTAFPLLAEFYSRLKNTKDIDTFVILGPDHWEKGRGDISISEADFITPFGRISSDLSMAKKLEESRFLVHDEMPFDDHSIQAQLLFIAKLFPDAKVVPIVFRSSVDNASAEKLGELIASISGPKTFIVGSVDFSHYLNEEAARPLDQNSSDVLSMIDPKLAGVVKADSPASLTALIAAVNKQGANISIPVGDGSFNSGQYSNMNDFTTGYVVKFFGSKKEIRSSSDRDGTMLFVGDVMLSRYVGEVMNGKGDYNLPFLKVADTIKDADLAFANLEGPISSRGANVGSKYSFRADPRVVQGLQFAGFDIVSVANNHMWDYGPEAFLDTLSHLKDAGIAYVGGGYDFKGAHEGVVKDINGTKVAFLGYTNLLPQSVSATENSAGVSYLNDEQIIKDIQEIKNKSDMVAVSFHWGEEYQAQHNQQQERIAKAAIDAGASLVIGHHPHVVQEVERYKDGWIAYSLGNFVFDQNFSKETTHSIILKIKISDNKIVDVISQPIEILGGFQPQLIGQ